MKGHIRAGSSAGTWYLRVELPRAGDGTRRQRRETVNGSKADAQRRLRSLLVEIENGGFADAGRMTVAELLAKWIASTEHRVGAKTHQRYSAIARLYLTPSLGSLRANALRPAHVEHALSQWISGNRKDREKGRISARTAKHILDTLKTACRWSVRMGILVRNPVDAVEPPRVEGHEMNTVDATGFENLLRAAADSELFVPILVAVGTGLRRGELLGLKWSDLTLDVPRPALQVRRSLETIDGKLHEKEPKTARSRRTLILAPFVATALLEHRHAQRQRDLLLGLGKRGAEAYVFQRADGSTWEPGAFSLAFYRLVRRAKLPKIRFHDLRHSFGSIGLAAGVDLKTISAALGHSAISTTANTYLHVVESLQVAAADRIDSAIGMAVGSALRNASVPQRCQTEPVDIKKPRGYRVSMVAPTGVEPVSPP